MLASRRQLLCQAGAGLASAALLLLTSWSALAQVKEEAENEPVTIVRKGIDKEIEVINIDLLEAEAKARLPQGVYVFIANGAGEQWTLREIRRAFGDFVFAPHRMGGIVRDKIDTSITMLGRKLPHPVFISPMGSHGLVHPEAEVATAEGAGQIGRAAMRLLCIDCQHGGYREGNLRPEMVPDVPECGPGLVARGAPAGSPGGVRGRPLDRWCIAAAAAHAWTMSAHPLL